MPYYDFVCPDCGHRFEAYLLISERDRRDIECPVCERNGASRSVSAGNLVSGRGGPAAMPVPT